MRRSFLTDAQLAPLLAAKRGSLLQLELAGCPTLTDAALLHLLPPPTLPAPSSRPCEGAAGEQEVWQDGQQADDAAPQPQQQQQAGPGRRPQAPPLQHLSLVCCDRMEGSTLRQLGRLRSLRLSGCPGVDEAALQAACVCCNQLTLLELPSHVSASSMPWAPAGAPSHLLGLQVVGGADETAGGRRSGGRRRSGGGGVPR